MQGSVAIKIKNIKIIIRRIYLRAEKNVYQKIKGTAMLCNFVPTNNINRDITDFMLCPFPKVAPILRKLKFAVFPLTYTPTFLPNFTIPPFREIPYNFDDRLMSQWTIKGLTRHIL